MTVFDILRYPLDDIFDDEEMSKIPYEVLSPWMDDCLKWLDYKGENLYSKYTKNWGTLICYVLWNATEDKYARNNLKHFFTGRLRRRLKDYI